VRRCLWIQTIKLDWLFKIFEWRWSSSNSKFHRVYLLSNQNPSIKGQYLPPRTMKNNRRGKMPPFCSRNPFTFPHYTSIILRSILRSCLSSLKKGVRMRKAGTTHWRPIHQWNWISLDTIKSKRILVRDIIKRLKL
jgi:hypothetical protein